MKHAYHSRPSSPRLPTRLAAHPDNAQPCATAPQAPKPSRAVVVTELASARRQQAQTAKSIQQLEAQLAAL